MKSVSMKTEADAKNASNAQTKAAEDVTKPVNAKCAKKDTSELKLLVPAPHAPRTAKSVNLTKNAWLASKTSYS